MGNVQEHNLFLGPAERADILIDFSQFAGKTIILYNDAPAAVPAADSRLDYYTGNFDMTAVGGHTSTQPGLGPNTRTIMQIRVAAADPLNPPVAYNLAAAAGGVRHDGRDAGRLCEGPGPDPRAASGLRQRLR